MSFGSLGLKTHQVGLVPSIEAAAKAVNRRGIVVRVRASDFTQPLGKMSASASEFTKSLEASNARVLAFGASAVIIGSVTASFAQLVIQATKVEKILADINAVLGTTAGNLEKFGDGLFNVARNTSQSLEVAAEAALEFSRQGLSMEETLKRTNDALILTRLTGLKAAESVKGLTAAVNGFADVGLTTTEIINKLAAVDVKFAVSADDLVNALARAGAVAQDAGVNFDQLIGAVTAAQQITARGGAVIGNSFKTIFTRIQRSSTLDRLEELGIAVRDIRGNTLPALTVLQNLSSSYDNLAVSTKAAVAEQVGGVFQINVLKAALKDLSKETSIYSQATMTSSQASNEAYEKNAMLQETLASIANQTLTTVRELTANLGELTIAPALKEFLESANNILGFISDMLGAKEGESLGSDFAQGIAKGLGNVLAGPGMVALVLIFGKLFASALKFAKNSVKDLLQIKTIKDQELAIQESIVDAMLKNVELSEKLVQLDGNQVKQEELVLAVLRQQTKEIEQQRKIAQTIAPTLRKAGVQPNLILQSPAKSQKTQNSSSGFIPNYSSRPTPVEEMKEKAGAKEGGYIAGKVSTMSIPKLGRVVYNDKETVKNFKGMDQPAIMPPKNSKAGKQYEKDFTDKHGFDPYGYGGFVPNFALKATKLPGTNILRLPTAKMINETTASDFRGNKIKGWRTLEATVDNVIKYAKTYSNELNELKKVGVNVLQRKMYFSNQSQYIPINKKKSIASEQKKMKALEKKFKKNPKAKRTKLEDFVIKNKHKITGNSQENALFQSSLQKKGYYPTWTGAYTSKGGREGKGDQNFKVDFFAPGRKPIESKYGKYAAPNLIAKSIRLYSDNYIEEFLSRSGRSDLSENMRKGKLKDSANMLTSLGYKDVDANKVLRAGLYGGFIPNFEKKQYTEKQVSKAIMKTLNKRGFRINPRDRTISNQISFAANRYLRDTKLKPNPGGTFTIGKHKIQMNELTLALNGHGDYMPGEGAQGPVINKTKSSETGKSNTPMSDTMAWLVGGQNSKRYNQGLIPNFASQNWQNEKSSGTVDDSVREMVEDEKRAQDKSGSKNHSHYSLGLIPNFYKAFKKTQKGMVDARSAYHLKDGRVFKPSRDQSPKQKTFKGKIAKLAPNRKTIDFNTVTTAPRVKTENIDRIAGPGIAISFNTKPGNAYEKAIADTYVIKGWTGTGPAYLDFSDAEWATEDMPKQNKLKTPIGSGPKNLVTDWRYADAHFGGGHGPRPILEKLIAKGLVKKHDIQDAMNTGVMDLTEKIPKFAEIVGAGGENLKYASSKIFKPLQADQGVNKDTFGNFEGTFNTPSNYSGKDPTNVAFKIKFPKDHFTHLNKPKKSGPIPQLQSHGHIPNFANPLTDAISREKEALRERGSAADIYIDQDDRLKNPKNPAGLLVANTRDEPKSGSQGVNRAISMGMDPKTHGASSGVVPNYSTPSSTSVSPKFNKQMEEAGDKMKKAGDASSDLMMRMMGLTTLTYAFQGAMGEASAEASDFQKGMSVLNGAVMGLTQAAMLGMVANPKNMISKGKSATFAPKGEGVTKGSRVMGAMKMAGGALLGVGMAAAALIPIYQAFKENTELLDTPLDTLRKSAEKTSKGLDALTNTISTQKEIENTRNEMMKLSNSSQANTYQGQMKRLKLSASLAKQQSTLSQETAVLADTFGFSGEEIAFMTSGTTEGMKKLQEAQVLYAQRLNAIQLQEQNIKSNELSYNSVMSNITKDRNEGGFFNFDLSKNLMESLSDAIFASEATSSNRKLDKHKLDVARVNQARSITADSEVFTHFKEMFSSVRGTDFDESGKVVPGRTLTQNISEYAKSGDFKKEQAANLMSTMFNSSDAGVSNLNIKEVIRLGEGFDAENKDSKKQFDIDQNARREIAQERARILMEIRLQAEALEQQTKFINMSNSNIIKEMEFRNKVKDSLNIFSNASQVEAEMAIKRKESEMQYTQDVEAANQKAIKARQDAVQKILKEGSDSYSGMFSSLDQNLTSKNVATGEVTVDAEAGTKEAFQGNLKKLQDSLLKVEDQKLQASFKQLAYDLDGVRNKDEANNKLLQLLDSAAKNATLQETLVALQSDNIGIIGKEEDLSKLNLEEIKKRLEQNKAFAAGEKTIRDQQLAIVEQEMHVSKNTLEGAKLKLEEYKKIKNPAKKIRDNLHEELDATIKTAGMSKEISDATFATLDSQEYRQKATEAMATTLTQELTQEYKTLVNQGARIEAEAELRKNTELYAKLIAQKVKNERGAIINQITDRATTTQANLRRDESGRNTFDYRTEDEVSKLTDSTINLRAQYEANKAANFYALEATEQLTQSQTKFAEEMDRLREKIKAKGFFQEGLNAVERDGLTATANVQTAAGKVAGYAEMGNTIRGAEAAVELARARKEENISRNSGDGNTLFSDTIAVRVAETNVELERFNETLANTTFDSVKQGFKDVVQMMGDGTKDMGDMLNTFFGGIAKAISDKLLDRAIGQLTSGVFGVLGLNKGGIVGYNSGGYAGGGKASQAPAMLTAGEYVVRKKVVDRLGANTLDKINNTGSLNALYNEPNSDSFDMSTANGAPMPPMLHMKEGGWLSRQWDKAKSALSSSASDSDWTKIAKGSGTLVGAGFANYEDRDKSDSGPEPPTAPSTARLNMSSDLNLDPSSKMMSSPARQGGNSYAKQYGDYLLKKYDYDVQKQNEKTQSRAQLWSGITNSLTMAFGSAQVGKMLKGVKGMYETRGGAEKTVARWNKQGINDMGDLREKKSDVFSTYQQEINRRREAGGMNRLSGDDIVAGKPLMASSEITGGMQPSCLGGVCGINSSPSISTDLSSLSNKEFSSAFFGNSKPSHGIDRNQFNQLDDILKSRDPYADLYSSGGKVRGPAGIDKVGPVMLDRGEYVIKASSVNNIEKQFPGFFDQLNAMRFNQGGAVGGGESKGGSSSPSAGNVTVNVNVSSSGESSTSGGKSSDQEMAAKIKDAVVGVISQEKRMGGMLRG